MALQLSTTKTGCSPHSPPSSCSRRVGWMISLSLGRYFRAPGQFNTPFSSFKKEKHEGLGSLRTCCGEPGTLRPTPVSGFSKRCRTISMELQE